MTCIVCEPRGQRNADEREAKKGRTQEFCCLQARQARTRDAQVCVVGCAEVIVTSEDELEELEENINTMYSNYKQRRGIRSKLEEKLLVKQVGLEDNNEGDSEEEEEEEDEKRLHELEEEFDVEPVNSDIEDEVEMVEKKSKEKGGGLVVNTAAFEQKAVEQEKVEHAQRWFADNIFDDVQTSEKYDLDLYQKEFGQAPSVPEHEEKEKEDIEMKEVNGDNAFQEPVSNGSNHHPTTSTTTTTTTDANASAAANGSITISSSSFSSEKEGESKDTKPFKSRDLPDVLRLPYRLQRKIKLHKSNQIKSNIYLCISLITLQIVEFEKNKQTEK
ncbi:myb domain-containing protein [Reticulomyxa filosa]|uniref:Myb domain-containing protein n=1 Tax=Reticulomyxa filosa TaxID=46433 RepID=X6MUK3_RETFI|nr:myb domain-containing protein [Reticulomyxa filosa]|eukprot:ETO17668.1 myb domain-containing protein [Reticulomyxa filosa]